MAISINRYVDITSGVGGTGGVRTRELVGRIFSTNQLIPTQSFMHRPACAPSARTSLSTPI